VPDGRQESPRASGNVKRERQLVWDADLSNQRLERIAQIIERCFACLTVADGPNTWPELGRCTPNTVLILFDGVRYVPVLARTLIATVSCSWHGG